MSLHLRLNDTAFAVSLFTFTLGSNGQQYPHIELRNTSLCCGEMNYLSQEYRNLYARLIEAVSTAESL